MPLAPSSLACAAVGTVRLLPMPHHRAMLVLLRALLLSRAGLAARALAAPPSLRQGS